MLKKIKKKFRAKKILNNIKKNFKSFTTTLLMKSINIYSKKILGA